MHTHDALLSWRSWAESSLGRAKPARGSSDPEDDEGWRGERSRVVETLVEEKEP